QEIEAIVLQQVRELLCNKPMLSRWMQEAGHASRIETGLARAEDALRLLGASGSPSQDIRAIIRMAVRRIDLASNRMCIAVDRSAVVSWLANIASPPAAGDAGLHIVDQ